MIVFLVRNDAQADFLLEHQRQAFPEGRPFSVFRQQPVDEQLRADIIGQVGNDPDWSAIGLFCRKSREIGLQRIAFDDF
ncbi:hypothetical protein D3C80_548030 [compost metagenome]